MGVPPGGAGAQSFWPGAGPRLFPWGYPGSLWLQPRHHHPSGSNAPVFTAAEVGAGLGWIFQRFQVATRGASRIGPDTEGFFVPRFL